MKNFYPLFIAFFLIAGMDSCKTEDAVKDEFCNDGILNAGEVEIDCGTGCEPCPSEGSVNCIVGNSTFFASGTHAYGQQLGPNIRIYGNNGNPLFFMFKPSPLNQPVAITAVSFAYRGEAYTMEPGDSGRAVLTALDTVRKIASGTFWFTAGRVTGPDTASVREGVFTNVRYNH